MHTQDFWAKFETLTSINKAKNLKSSETLWGWCIIFLGNNSEDVVYPYVGQLN